MDQRRAKGGGGDHVDTFRLRISPSKLVPKVVAGCCRHASLVTKSTVAHCRSILQGGRFIAYTICRGNCFRCALRVIPFHSRSCKSLRASSSAYSLPSVNLQWSVFLLSAVLLILTLFDFSHGRGSSFLVPSFSVIRGLCNIVASPFVLASAMENISAATDYKSSHRLNHYYVSHYSSSTSTPFSGTVSIAGMGNPTWDMNVSLRAKQDGRRLAATNSKMPSDTAPANDRETRSSALRTPRSSEGAASGASLPPSSKRVLSSSTSDTKKAQEPRSQPSASASLGQRRNHENDDYGDDSDFFSVIQSKRRCASFSHAPLQSRTSSGSPLYALPYVGRPNSQVKIRSSLPREAERTPTPLLSAAQPSNPIPNDFTLQFQALLRDTPHSVAENLWNQVPATERSAFAEMGMDKPYGSGKKSNGVSPRTRADSRGRVAGDESSPRGRDLRPSVEGTLGDLTHATVAGPEGKPTLGFRRPDGQRRHGSLPYGRRNRGSVRLTGALAENLFFHPSRLEGEVPGEDPASPTIDVKQNESEIPPYSPAVLPRDHSGAFSLDKEIGARHSGGSRTSSVSTNIGEEPEPPSVSSGYSGDSEDGNDSEEASRRTSASSDDSHTFDRSGRSGVNSGLEATGGERAGGKFSWGTLTSSPHPHSLKRVSLSRSGSMQSRCFMGGFGSVEKELFFSCTKPQLQIMLVALQLPAHGYYVRVAGLRLRFFSAFQCVFCSAGGEKRSIAYIKRLFTIYFMYLEGDVRLRRQFALLVLSSLEWPMYTQSEKWHRPQLDKWFGHLLKLVEETLSLQVGNLFGNILLQELRELGWILRSFEDFERFLRGQSKVDLHLRVMLMYIPGHLLAIDLNPQTLQAVYSEVSSLQMMYYSMYELNSPHATWLLQWNFIQEVHLRWSMLQLLGITHKLITNKPLTGVLILQVDKINTQEEQVIRLFDREEDKSTQEALMRFETTVTSALTMRIQMVAKHFKKMFASDSMYQQEFQLPKCHVTAFYLKPEESKKAKQSNIQFGANAKTVTTADDASQSTSEAIETGLFGFEIDLSVAKELKDKLPPGSMYIQLSLIDPWDYNPVYTPLADDPSVIPAYRATQILKANLEHDPSLVRVGIAKIVYTTIVDAYNSFTPNQTGYDNDRHLVFRVVTPAFKSEDAFLAGLVGMVCVPSIHNAAPGTLNPHRIKLIGSARRLPQGEILKTGNFLSGIDYRHHKSIESLVEADSVAVHVFLEGLKEKSTNSIFELPAATLFDRVVRRGRSKFTIIHAEIVPKKTNPFAPEPENQREYGAEHADTIAAMSKRRAMFFARSRSMLVPRSGARKCEWSVWDGDQLTKSTAEEPNSVDSGSESRLPTGGSRNRVSLRGGPQTSRFATAIGPLARKGSLFIGRSIQHRQHTDLLTCMPPDDVEPSVGTATASSTVPTLSAVPAGSTGSGIRTHRSSSSCTEEISTREVFVDAETTHHRGRSLPPRKKASSARNGFSQRLSSPAASPAPLRTLELAKSYRRERQSRSTIVSIHQQFRPGVVGQNSFPSTPMNAGIPVAQYRTDPAGHRRKRKPSQHMNDYYKLNINPGGPGIASHDQRTRRSTRSKRFVEPSRLAANQQCEPAHPGDMRGPAGVV